MATRARIISDPGRHYFFLYLLNDISLPHWLQLLITYTLLTFEDEHCFQKQYEEVRYGRGHLANNTSTGVIRSSDKLTFCDYIMACRSHSRTPSHSSCKACGCSLRSLRWWYGNGDMEQHHEVPRWCWLVDWPGQFSYQCCLCLKHAPFHDPVQMITAFSMCLRMEIQHVSAQDV